MSIRPTIMQAGPPARRRSLLVATALAGAVLLMVVVLTDFGQSGATAGDKPEQPKIAATPEHVFKKQVKPFLTKYCVGCHGAKRKEGEISLQRINDFASARRSLKTWEKVAAMLEAGAMPPDDHQLRPTEDESKSVLTWIDKTFINIDCTGVRDPGRVTIRRLNRNEYRNTIRDLVGIDFEAAGDFPSDDVGYGFDNIGDVLSLPPLLMEKYMDAAERIAERAIVIGDPSQRTAQRLAGKKLKSTPRGGPGKRGYFHLNTTAAAVFGQFEFTKPGEYIVRAEAGAFQAGPKPAQMQLRIAGQPLEVHNIKGHLEPGVYSTRVKIGKGEKIGVGRHKVEAVFLNDYYKPKAKYPKDRDRNLLVKSLEVQGPLGETSAEYPETHTRIVVATPGPNKTAAQCAREIFRRFATRAYRRPVSDDEIEGVVHLVDAVMKNNTGTKQEKSFERGIQLGIQAILVSPHFLFRIEEDRQPDNPRHIHPVGDYELASRLSYFLWSSMPDDALFALAAKGKLHKPDVFEQQVRRMLADGKSRALVENFAGQWLNLRNLDEAAPNPKLFPTFDAKLKDDMRRETQLFFETVVHENLSIFTFLDGEFTFVNERLAGHYGIPDIKGEEFRRVSLAKRQRAGVLTHAGILTLTSDPARTLPVKRGKWILENILGTPPPPPPANVPELAETTEANPKATLREQLKLHRSDPTCAACHKVMDPLGLGFENFDAIGRWRDKDGDRPIDPSGTLPDGASFKNPRELLNVIKSRKNDFTRHLVRTMLTYALGRGLEYYDRCAVDRIMTALQADGFRFQKLIVEIVKSDPFLKRRGDGGQP